VWGVVSLIEKCDPWPAVKPFLLREEGPVFLKDPEVADWGTINDLPGKAASFVYRACPVVGLVDANAVERVIVDPLLQIFQPSS